MDADDLARISVIVDAFPDIKETTVLALVVEVAKRAVTGAPPVRVIEVRDRLRGRRIGVRVVSHLLRARVLVTATSDNGTALYPGPRVRAVLNMMKRARSGVPLEDSLRGR